MYNEQIEQLISAALADGVLTEKEKQILFKKAQAEGIDLDEFEMVLDARLVELSKAEKAKAEASAPKSNKLGDVKKCPACGAMVQSYQGVCPECGYAFEGVDANSAVKELSNLLQKTSDHDKMEKIIDNYPIPMEKAALLAFVTWLRPQSIDSKNPLANSYFKKYSECVNKIRVSFSTDKDLQLFLAYFQEDEKKIKNQKIVKLTLKNKWFWIGIAVFILVILIIKPKPLNENKEKTTIAIQNAISNGEIQKAEQYYLDYKNNKKDISQLAGSIVHEYLLQNNEADAIRFAHAIGVPNSGSSLAWGVEEVANELSDYYIKDNRFEEAISIYGTWLELGRLKKIITNVCEKGDKNTAIKLTNEFCVYGTISLDGTWNKEDVEKEKNELINYIKKY